MPKATLPNSAFFSRLRQIFTPTLLLGNKALTLNGGTAFGFAEGDTTLFCIFSRLRQIITPTFHLSNKALTLNCGTAFGFAEGDIGNSLNYMRSIWQTRGRMQPPHLLSVDMPRALLCAFTSFTGKLQWKVLLFYIFTATYY